MNFTQEQQAAMWEIVRALADDEPYCYHDNRGVMECLFCNDFWGWGPYEKHTHDHEPDCLVMKARALVEQIAKEPTA